MIQFYYIKEEHRLPRTIVAAVIAICALPFLFQLFGVDFGNSVPASLSSQITGASELSTDDMFYRLSGGFTHALLEWTAFSAAIFVVLLAFCHYSITDDITTPVIGVALFCAGCMDGFHTLAATRLVTAVADNTDLIPFTWALSRVFNAIIMIIGVGIFLSGRKIPANKGMKFILITSVVFVAIGFLLINFAATSHNLPQTQFPESFIRRPYDIVPLVLFLIAGVVVYPLFMKRYPSIFASALFLSAIPEIAVELHMAFGSQRLFDSDFNVAHFLKIIAYVIPLIGLVLDYIQTYKDQIKFNDELSTAHGRLNIKAKELNRSNERLSQSNAELEKFAYIASHDLQEPLRKIQAFGDRLHKRLSDVDDEKALDYISRMQNSSTRMRSLIDDLLKLSRVGSEKFSIKTVNLNNVINTVIDDLSISISEKSAKITVDELPDIEGESNRLYQLFLNLISNSLKFSKTDESPIISITGQHVIVKDVEYLEIRVQDNGIGFEPEYSDKIFEVFQRLHGRSQYEGTGIGLAVCKKIVEKHNGRIRVESELDKGTCFILDLETRLKA